MLVQEEKYLHASLTIKVIPDANVTADNIITSSHGKWCDDINDNPISSQKILHCSIKPI
ncbi:MAG TPA: hypothetical protein VE076_02970 [Nitrososphaeraceae archaeon]|jgi:hypothetical protein|nr:hypothetical protein [Nitrososphaeraceae archaeon]